MMCPISQSFVDFIKKIVDVFVYHLKIAFLFPPPVLFVHQLMRKERNLKETGMCGSIYLFHFYDFFYEPQKT